MRILDVVRDISAAVVYASGRGYQIHPDAFAFLNSLNFSVHDIVKKIIDKKVKLREARCIFTEDIKIAICAQDIGITSKSIVATPYNKTIELIHEGKHDNSNNQNSNRAEYEILFDPSSKLNSAVDEHDYIKLFQSRYNKLLRILGMRSDSKRIRRIQSVKHEYNKKRMIKTITRKSNIVELKSQEPESMVVAGLLMSRRQNKNTMEIAIDDFSGALSAVAIRDDLRKQISKLILDQLVMLEISSGGKSSRNFVIENITSPDIPDHVPNKSISESYLVLISDLHVGSRYFMETEFKKFITWLCSDDEIAKKVKFLCIAGDIIDGIGIFPNQDKELNEFDSKKQFMHAINLLYQVPKNIEVFIIPGNHDMGRRALPQGSLSGFVDVNSDNFHMVGNPSLVKLNGVKLLIFHGQSLDDIIATTPGLSYSSPAEAMKVLLKVRHLSPIYGQRTPIAPEQDDMLVINEVPDIFHAGHVHIIDVERYRNTLIVNSGAWQSQTKYQQTMGIIPTPGIAILVDLSTLQPFQKNFTS
jgi:DNA polymerase II small subunit